MANPLRKGTSPSSRVGERPARQLAAIIVAGRFSIPAAQGNFAGSFRVEIASAPRKTGKQIKDSITGIMIDEYTQWIPVRYNRESELTAEVTDEGPNRFKFALESN